MPPKIPEPVPIPPLPIAPKPAPPIPKLIAAPAYETPEGQCASWKKSGQERYRGDEMTIMTDVPAVECEVRTQVSVQSGPHQDILETQYRYFYEGKQFCKEIIRFTNTIESARGKDCTLVPSGTETRKLEFGKDVDVGDIIPLKENTRYILVMPTGRVFVKETPKEEAGGSSLGVIVITKKEGMIEMSLENGFFYFQFKKSLKWLSGESEEGSVLDFLILTRFAALRMKGTEFSVDVAPDGTTAVHVLDGTVTVSDRATGDAFDVKSGFGAIAGKDESLILTRVRAGQFDPWWESFPEATLISYDEGESKKGFGVIEFVIVVIITVVIGVGIRYFRYFVRRLKAK